MKPTYHLIITTLLLETITAATPEQITQECMLIGNVLQALPPQKQAEIKAVIQEFEQENLSDEKLYQKLYTLRMQMILTHSRFLPIAADANTLSESYSLDKVWQALFYCGLGCALFLGITAMQDMDAKQLLEGKNNALNKIKTKHTELRNATTASIKMVKTLITEDV
jgi:hypothetical protein